MALTDSEFTDVFPFTKARPNQREVIDQIIDAFEDGNKSNVVLNAPVGFGKSPVALAVGRYLGDAFFLTHQRCLQNQYSKSFRIPSIFGKRNYQCGRSAHFRCDFGVCAFQASKKNSTNSNVKCKDCPYYTARKIAFEASHSVFNYDYFLNMSRSDCEFMKTRDLLVCDECHNLEEILIKFAAVNLSQHEFDHVKIPLITLPNEKASDDKKVIWLREVALPHLQGLLEEVKCDISELEPTDKALKQKLIQNQFLETVTCQCGRLFEQLAGNQLNRAIINHQNDTIEYKLLYGDGCYTQYLSPYGKKSLLMSATVFGPEILCKSLGINYDDTEFISVDSSFPPENSPFYIAAVGSMSYNNKLSTLPKIAGGVQIILEKHKNERGIIHTINYEIAKYIMDNVPTDRFIMPRGKDRD